MCLLYRKKASRLKTDNKVFLARLLGKKHIYNLHMFSVPIQKCRAFFVIFDKQFFSLAQFSVKNNGFP